MSLSGITVTDEVMAKYHLIFDKKAMKWVKFAISDDLTTVQHDPEKEKKTDLEARKKCLDGETNDQESWEEMVNGLDDKIPEYILYDFTTKLDDGRKIEKCIFVNWCSDNCPMRKRMVHSSTTNTVKDKFKGIQKHIQANDKGDLDFKEVLEKVLSA